MLDVAGVHQQGIPRCSELCVGKAAGPDTNSKHYGKVKRKALKIIKVKEAVE
jgi:hypothetical protein